MQVDSQRGWILVVFTSLGLFAGCNSGDSELREYGQQDQDAVHPTHGPHEGHLIELGEEEYHAELVFDPKTRVTTIYVLGSDAKTAHPIDAAGELILHLEGEHEAELTLTANPQEGEDEGKSSRFELAADQLPEGVKDEEAFHGHIHITIDGKEYGGEIAHDH